MGILILIHAPIGRFSIHGIIERERTIFRYAPDGASVAGSDGKEDYNRLMILRNKPFPGDYKVRGRFRA